MNLMITQTLWEVGDYNLWKLRQEVPSSRAPSREAAKPSVQAVQAPVPVRLNPLRAVLKVTAFWAEVNMVKVMDEIGEQIIILHMVIFILL